MPRLQVSHVCGRRCRPHLRDRDAAVLVDATCRIPRLSLAVPTQRFLAGPTFGPVLQCPLSAPLLPADRMRTGKLARAGPRSFTSCHRVKAAAFR